MGRLFTIGDSISQGFRSGATAFTENAYSTYLAQALNETSYRRLQWPQVKLKIDLEGMMRMLESKFGSDVSAVEWLPILGAISSFQDQSEDYYERGEWSLEKPIPNYEYDFTDNCSVEGMRVADAWEVTPKLCLDKVFCDENSAKDNFGISMASAPFYRAAYKVLNPKANPQYNDYSAIKWLEYVASTEGIDNTVVFLGANNALGTIFKLKLEQKDFTPSNEKTYGSRLNVECKEDEYTLWHPKSFEHDYKILVSKVENALRENKNPNWKVYLGTVPLVTVAPMIEGFGEARLIDDPRDSLGTAKKQFRYYEYYKHYGVNESTAVRLGKLMKFRDALFIDKVIIEYNRSIQRIANDTNAQLGRCAFVVVDISNALTEMAWKRNSGMPSYQYPQELQWFYPPINTKYYDVNEKGDVVDGGIFSLDGIHPTVIGQGIIAHEFLKAMVANGTAPLGSSLDWNQIICDDDLRQRPVKILDSLVDKWQAVDFIMNALSAFGRV